MFIRGTVIGTRTCGYGERFIVEATEMPKFKNNGFNHWHCTNAKGITVDGLDCNHVSFDGGDYFRDKGAFQGWVFIRHNGKETPVFLSPDMATMSHYKISG